jgi:hypothetical protein
MHELTCRQYEMLQEFTIAVCTYIDGRHTKRKGQKLDSALPIGLGIFVQGFNIVLLLGSSSLLLCPALCWGACDQPLFLLFDLSIVAMVFVFIIHIDDASIFFSSMKHSDHQGGRCTGRKLELLADDDLPSQWHSKDDTEEADTYGPDYKLEEREMDTGSFALGLVRLEQVLESRNDANKATSQRHGSYRSSDRLHQNIFHRRERIGQRPRDSLEPGETQQSARHGHTRDPSSL